jgi:hypothetical protein
VGSGYARISFSVDIAYLQQVPFCVGKDPPAEGFDARWFRRIRVKKNQSADAKKERKLKKYVPPALVDYGNVTKITAAPKVISGTDNPGTSKNGSCL